MTSSKTSTPGSSDAATKTGNVLLSLREKIAYGMGDFGNGFMFDLGQAYLLKFYTDVAGLNAGVAGTIFVVTKIFDAFMDPLAGGFVDGRKSVGKGGRFKPVMFYSAIALGILTVFTFLTPGGSHGVNLFYAYISYMAWGVLYSFTNVPYGSLASVMTQNAEERAKLASFRQAGSVGALLVTGVAFMPIVLAFQSERVGFAVAAVTMSVVGILCFGATARFTNERVAVKRTPEKLHLSSFVTTIVRNKPLLVLILMTLFSIAGYNTRTQMVVFFTQYYLDDVSLLPYVNAISIGASIVGILTMPYLTRKMGKKNTALLGFAIAAVSDALNFILPAGFWSFSILLAISYIGVALPNGITWAMVSDAIDFGHWRTGERREGITYSAFNFSRKIAQSIAGGIAGFGLGLIGYVPNIEQPASTLLGMKFLQTGVPCLLMVVSALVIGLLYPLTDKRHEEIVQEIHEREGDDAVIEDQAGAAIENVKSE